MTVKLLTEHHFEFLSLNGSYKGSCQNTTLMVITCDGSDSVNKDQTTWIIGVWPWRTKLAYITNSSNCDKGMCLRVYEKFAEKLRWSNI